MEEKKTALQKKFEEQTPSIKGITGNEYNLVYCSWLELQVEKKTPSTDLKEFIVDLAEGRRASYELCAEHLDQRSKAAKGFMAEQYAQLPYVDKVIEFINQK